MKNKVLGYVFIVFVFAAMVCVLVYMQVSNSIPEDLFLPNHQVQGPKTEIYTNSQYNFQFNYDKKYEVDTSGDQTNFFQFPAKSVASASIPQSFYPKTNFGSANMTVAVQPTGLESSCQTSAKTRVVNGIMFHESEENQGAAGTAYQTKIYRVFQNQACFEVSLTTGIANIGNFEPDTVAQVDQTDVWNRLDQMLKTFKFTLNFPAIKTGVLAGQVTIGPNCPVERKDVPCPPPAGAFAKTQIIVYKSDGSTVVAKVLPEAVNDTLFGTYSLKLETGKYLVDYQSDIGFKSVHTKRPVTITAGKTTNLDFDIDTGIR